MKVQVNISHDAIKVNETFSGKNAEEVVGGMKARVAKELPFAQRLAVNAAPNLMFVQEVVKRYNTSQKTSHPIPGNCDEFIQTAVKLGFATIIEN